MLNVAIKAARAAGSIINRAALDVEAVRVSQKSMNDFVTEVDHASEQVIIDTLQRLLNDGYLTRFGPLFQIEKAGGQFVLAAVTVPEERFDEVTEYLNGLPQVAHNYRREHRLNMWFVVATESQAAAQQTIDAIEAHTHLKVYAFPKEKEFFVELRLPLKTSRIKEFS